MKKKVTLIVPLWAWVVYFGLSALVADNWVEGVSHTVLMLIGWRYLTIDLTQPWNKKDKPDP